MTSSIAPRVRVSGPGGTPARFGLFAAAAVVEGVDGHDLNGVEYEAACAVPVDLWVVPCADTDLPEVSAFRVVLTKPAGQNLLVGQLVQRHAGYGTSPVSVDVDGVVKTLVAVGDVQTWAVVAAEEILIEGSTLAVDPLEACTTDAAEFTVPATGVAAVLELTCSVASPYLTASKEPRRTRNLVSTNSFAVYVAEDCGMVGRDSSTAKTDLRNRLLLGEQTAVERTVWTGEVGNAFALAPTAVPLVDGQARDLLDAIGLLETWLAATTGQVGVIHAPRWLAPRLALSNLANTSGQRATTPLGSSWSLGAGYPGTPPDGVTDDGALWLYATGPVTVRRSAVIEPADWSSGGLNTSTNRPFLLAERIYLVDWPCTAAAVKTSLTRADYVPVPVPEELTP